MRKLIAILKEPTRTLKIFESKNKLRGEVYDEQGNRTMSADFFYDDGDMDEFRREYFGLNDGDINESRIRDYFGFENYYRVPFERKNGKIVLYPINKQKRVIWTNDDYDEWCEAMANEITDEEITPEYYGFCCETNLSDERCNLDVEIDGYIVAFANLGLWNGRHNGGKFIGHNVKDILYSDCDYVTWYCDLHNVRCDAIHHDGTNHYLYRVADTKEKAEILIEKIAFKDMSEEEFRRATKSLRPYVAKVYGW